MMEKLFYQKENDGIVREYREVSRQAEIGELVKVVGTCSDYFYSVGDVAKTTRVIDGMIFAKFNDGKVWAIGHASDDCNRYVVQEPTGNEFREVARKAKRGELVMIVSDNWSYGKAGSVHKVVDEDYPWGMSERDGTGVAVEPFNPLFHYKYVVLESVAKHGQYREVKRTAQPGEKIKIVAPGYSGGRYKLGDVLTVRERRLNDSVRTVEVPAPFIEDKEYVVLEPITAANDIIEHDGKKYYKATLVRKAEVGELVVVVGNTSHDQHRYEIGEVVRITTGPSKYGSDPGRMKGNRLGWWMRDDDYRVLEPLQETPPITLMYNGKQYRFVNRKANVGELVLVTANTTSHELVVGEVVKVTQQGKAKPNRVSTDEENTWMTPDCYLVLEAV